MTHLEALLAALAATEGRAQGRAVVRHTQLSDQALAIVAFQPAAEPFSALAVAYGSASEDPQFFVVLEPRNRTLLFRAMTPFARTFNEWFRSFGRARVPVRRGKQELSVAADAPQVLVPNSATINVLARWGRRFAYLSTEGEYAADPALPELGRHLQFLADHAAVPGQALVVAATALVRRHWVTGQSELEDENLASLDAWIDPPKGTHAFDRAAEVENIAVGPLLQPEDDSDVFELIQELNELRERKTDPTAVTPLLPRLESKCRPFVEAAWLLLWRSIERERSTPKGASVAARWEQDRIAYTEHLDFVRSGRRRSARDSVRRAARLRMRLEEAQAKLEAQEAADDPLTMAGHILRGEAIRGRVVKVDAGHMEPGRRRAVHRPLIVVEIPDAHPLTLGTELWWSEDPASVCGVVHAVDRSADGFRVTIKIVAGLKRSLPEFGSEACFSVLTTKSGPWRPLPIKIPWTHEPSRPAVPDAIDDGAPAWEGRADAE